MNQPPRTPRTPIKNSPMRKFFLPDGGGVRIMATAMKQFCALLTVFSMLTAPTFAWTGGPYSNNTYDGLDGGIFQYTVRGDNVSGLARFSQNTSSAYNSEFGDSVIYYNGVTYYGESYGFIDYAGSDAGGEGLASGIINATASGTDLNNPAAVLRSANGTSFGVFNGVRYGTGNPLFGPYSPGGPESTYMVCNAQWDGHITKKFPTPRFSGTGTATFFGEGESDETISSDRTLVSTGDFLNPRANNLPEANGTQRDFTTVPSDAFKNKTSVAITVYGGRISTSPYLGSNAYQAL